MKDVPATPLKTLQAAKEIGMEAGLNYVYIGNTANISDMNTKCPQCDYVLIERLNFGIIRNNIKEWHCPNCGTKIAGVG